MELAIVIIVLALAAALAGWRVLRTLRVSQGKGEAHACGKCPANQS